MRGNGASVAVTSGLDAGGPPSGAMADSALAADSKSTSGLGAVLETNTTLMAMASTVGMARRTRWIRGLRAAWRMGCSIRLYETTARVMVATIRTTDRRGSVSLVLATVSHRKIGQWYR